jgi:hypothetical protein
MSFRRFIARIKGEYRMARGRKKTRHAAASRRPVKAVADAAFAVNLSLINS